MAKNMNAYKDVTLDSNGFDKNYRHPLTKRFQYEYALYESVAKLFESVRCKSMCIKSLELYFAELPRAKKDNEDSKKITQEKVLDEVSNLVANDVVGKIDFPMMNLCAAESQSILEEDGTHSFIFSDGIYGFKVSLEMTKNKHLKGIKVFNLSGAKPKENKSGTMCRKKKITDHAADPAA